MMPSVASVSCHDGTPAAAKKWRAAESIQRKKFG